MSEGNSNENNSKFDPYTILHLNRDATQSQIKSAYRKLALRYHPDRQRTEEDKILCKEKFLEVSRSYEVLGDPKLKEQYDKYGILHDESSASGYSSPNQNARDFFGGFAGGFSGRNFGSRGGFTDPFEMFHRMFDDDFFGNDGRFSSFHDSFSGGRSSNHSSSNFDQPWGFGRSGFGSAFGGFGSGFNHHMNMMNDMMNMHVPSGSSSRNGMSTSYYSSSSSSFGGGGGIQESMSTSTRMINGKRQTVTERVKVHPDGTVERSTETSGDDDFPSMMLENDDKSKTSTVKHLLQDDNTRDQVLQNNDNAGEKERVQKKHRFFSRRDGSKDEK